MSPHPIITRDICMTAQPVRRVATAPQDRQSACTGATMTKATTWANGLGVWHVRVPRGAASPVIAARRALRDELEPRVTNLDARIWRHPIRVPSLDTESTIVYREGEID